MSHSRKLRRQIQRVQAKRTEVHLKKLKQRELEPIVYTTCTKPKVWNVEYPNDGEDIHQNMP